VTYISELSFAALEAGKVKGQERCRAQFGFVRKALFIKNPGMEQSAVRWESRGKQ